MKHLTQLSVTVALEAENIKTKFKQLVAWKQLSTRPRPRPTWNSERVMKWFVVFQLLQYKSEALLFVIWSKKNSLTFLHLSIHWSPPLSPQCWVSGKCLRDQNSHSHNRLFVSCSPRLVSGFMNLHFTPRKFRIMYYQTLYNLHPTKISSSAPLSDFRCALQNTIAFVPPCCSIRFRFPEAFRIRSAKTRDPVVTCCIHRNPCQKSGRFWSHFVVQKLPILRITFGWTRENVVNKTRNLKISDYFERNVILF